MAIASAFPCVLLLRHDFFPRGLEVEYRQQELRSDELVICRAHSRGGRFDEARGRGSSLRSDWSKVRLILSGHLFARTSNGGVVVGPGDMVVSRGWDDHRWRALDDVTDYVLVGWKHRGPAGDRPRDGGPLRLGGGVDARSGPVAHARALAHELDGSGNTAQVMSAVASMLASLATFGLPLSAEAARAVSIGIDPVHQIFADAMQRVVFPLTSRPMAVDFSQALGLSQRQTLRVSNEFFTRFYVTTSRWRDYVSGMRLELGMFFCSSPRSTTEIVSRALGFGAPATLCHAFHSAGLPSPREVRRELRGG